MVQERDIYNIPSKRRNPVIADIFNRLHFMERRGSGFKKICEDYAFAEGYTDEKKPCFVSDSDNFTLILPNLNYDAAKGAKKGTNIGTKKSTKVDERTDAVLKIIKKNPSISQRQLAEELGITRKMVMATLNRLVETQKIKREGSVTHGKWIIL